MGYCTGHFKKLTPSQVGGRSQWEEGKKIEKGGNKVEKQNSKSLPALKTWML